VYAKLGRFNGTWVFGFSSAQFYDLAQPVPNADALRDASEAIRTQIDCSEAHFRKGFVCR
jgi:hypothetical protein